MAKHESTTVEAFEAAPPYDDGSVDIPEKYGGTAADRHDMEVLGKKQVFRRNFRLITMLGFSSTAVISWECLPIALMFALVDGGPPVLFWGLIVGPIGFSLVYASLAEMASMCPTAGGQYVRMPEQSRIWEGLLTEDVAALGQRIRSAAYAKKSELCCGLDAGHWMADMARRCRLHCCGDYSRPDRSEQPELCVSTVAWHPSDDRSHLHSSPCQHFDGEATTTPPVRRIQPPHLRVFRSRHSPLGHCRSNKC